MKKIETGYTPSKNFLLLFEILWSVRRANGAGCSVLILFAFGLHSNQEEESMWITNVVRILWLHKNLSTKDTCPMRHLLGFKFFHKPYQVLELIPCTEYLSPERQKLHFWKLKLVVIIVHWVIIMFRTRSVLIFNHNIIVIKWECGDHQDNSFLPQGLFFSHSFAITVFDTDSAVIAEHKSNNMCLLLEKSCSTEMLTPGMAKTSQAMQASMGKSTTCFWEQKLSAATIEMWNKNSPSTT